jgi:predicted XRE-type DNA-binding protein
MGTNHKTTDIDTGSSNIFTDLRLEDADQLLTRTALGIQVMKTIRESGFSQQEAGKRLGLTQPDVSAIMRAKFRRFSQERLIGLLNKLEQKVTIHITRHRKGEPYQQVTLLP